MAKYALIGNPNVGKTSLYNRLTHSFEHVGNWHGVTVDKVGSKIKADKDIELCDLPGLYSLTVYSKEEEITRDEVINGNYDLFIYVCDAANLHRCLYLFLQLCELKVPVMIVVNMLDELQKSGKSLDEKLLSDRLGVPVIALSANKGFDCERFLSIAASASEQKRALPYLNKLPLRQVGDIIGSDSVYMQIKALEGDEYVLGKLGVESRKLKKFGDNALVAKVRYEYIDKALDGVVVEREKESKARRVAGKFDVIALNKFLALPVFVLIMSGIFWVTFGFIGKFLTDLLESGKDLLMHASGQAMLKVGLPKWMIGLVCEGIIDGVGGVLVFLPQIVILFFFLALLEDSGYISRVAFMTDGFFGKIGLSGRAVFTMIMGFGCSATAVLTSRGLEDDTMRKKTAVLTPFISCSARLPVYTAVLGSFFAHGSVPIIIGLYLLGCVVVIACAAIMNGTKRLKSGEASFIMEMPPYRIPTFARVMQIILHNIKAFLVKVGTIVFSLSIIVWVLSNFSLRYGYIGMGSGESIMEKLGAVLAPLFAPLGFGNWKAVTALISGLMAKEVVISTLTSLGGAGEVPGNSLAAICFSVYTLLYVPCVATLGAVKKEAGTKWMLFGLIMQLTVAYIAALSVRMVGLAFIEGPLNGIVMLAFVVILFLSVWTIRSFTGRRCKGCIKCGGCV